MNWLLSAIVFLPLVGGIVVMLLPERWTRWTAAIITLGVFALTLWLYFGLLINGSSFGTVANPAWKESYDWINITVGTFHFQLRYELGTDGLSMPMIILNGLLSFLAVVSSWHIEKRIKFYMAMILVLEFGVMGVFAAFDLFLFFLFWEVELIPMFLLIGIWGGARREYAAWKFLIYTFTASAFTLAGIFLLYFQTGAVSGAFEYLSSQVAQSKVVGTLPFFGAGGLAPAGDLPVPLRGVRGEAADVAGAYLAARRAHRGADGGERAAGGRAAQDGRVWPDPHLPGLRADRRDRVRHRRSASSPRSTSCGARAPRWSSRT